MLGNRRRKKSGEYEILIIPQGDGGGGTRSIKANGLKFALWGSAAFVILFVVFFIAFRFTPLGRLVGITAADQDALNIAEEGTQRRIGTLAEEIAVLKDYNTQLRKALGGRTEKESSSAVEEKNRESQIAQSQEPVVTQEFVPAASTISALASSSEGLKTSFPLLAPVQGIITQGFEPNQKHFGVDYAAKVGTPVHASAQGYVVFSGWTYDYGNTLILSHGGGYITAYKHNSSILKSTGSLVRRGELISLVGSTGKTSKGPHLHFEILKDGVPQDPQQFLLNATTL